MRLRQAIQLTGLDTHKYKAALEGIATIHSTFTKYMRSDKLQAWTPDTFREWSAVGAGNRYFSTGVIAASAEAVPFNNLVDPDGVLAAVDSDKYRHTIDNEVGYFERQKKDDGGFRYDLCLQLMQSSFITVTLDMLLPVLPIFQSVILLKHDFHSWQHQQLMTVTTTSTKISNLLLYYDRWH